MTAAQKAAGAVGLKGDQLAPAPQWLVDKLGPAPKREASNDIVTDEIDTDYAIQRALAYIRTAENAVIGAGASDQCYRVAAHVKDYGISEDMCLELLLEHWNPENSPVLAPEDLQERVANAYRYGKQPVGILDPVHDFDAIEPEDIVPLPAAETWPAEEPLDIFGDATLTGEPELRREWLPTSIAGFAFDAAERMGVEPAMIAVPALAAAAGAMHDGFRLQPRQYDTEWTEPPCLWFAMVAEPGSRKTPAIDAAIKPLKKIEHQWMVADRKALAEYERAVAAQQTPKSKKAKVEEAAGELPATPEEVWTEGSVLQRPRQRRKIVGDATIEALGSILQDNAGGVLACFDELAGLIASFDAYRANGSSGKDRSAWLELFQGGPRAIDRASRQRSFTVENWSASVIGGIQPDRMRELAAKCSMQADGLLQRFLPFCPRVVGKGIDRTPDIAALNGYADVIRKLTEVEPTDFNNRVRLSAGALEQAARVADFADKILLLPDSSPAMRGHLAKWSGMFARLVLVYHAVNCMAVGTSIADTVPEATARQVANLMLKYFFPNVARFYADVIGQTKNTGHARWIAGYILSRGLDQITVRDIGRAYHDLRDRKDDIPRVMQTLDAAGWVNEVDPGRGKPPKQWKINPAVHTVFAARAAEERQRREREKANILRATAKVDELLGAA